MDKLSLLVSRSLKQRMALAKKAFSVSLKLLAPSIKTLGLVKGKASFS